MQACIPRKILLPVGVEKIVISENSNEENRLVHAKERSQDGDLFIYDLEILSSDSHIREVWKGLRLQAINGSNFNGEWIEPLLAVYLERKANELFENANIRIALLRDSAGRQRGRRKVFQQVVGENVEILYRNDGKPEVTGGKFVSASHTGDLTLAAASETEVGCDIETVTERDFETWSDLLGEEGFKLAETVAAEANEDFHVSATRIWSAKECFKKLGISFSSNLTLSAVTQDGWVNLSFGDKKNFSFIAKLQNLKIIFGISGAK